MPTNMMRNENARPEPISEVAQQKTSSGAADADGADQKHRRSLRDAVIERVRNEMHERNEQPERADEAGGI